jgi:hypothetical protein
METSEEIIARLKKEFGNNFRQDKKNQWRFEVFTELGRSQVVTMELRDRKHSTTNLSRYVCSSSVGPLFRGINLDFILRFNFSLDVGTFAIRDVEDEHGTKTPNIVFMASHLAATADYEEIWEMIVKTGNYADKLENEIFHKDSE